MALPPGGEAKGGRGHSQQIAATQAIRSTQGEAPAPQPTPATRVVLYGLAEVQGPPVYQFPLARHPPAPFGTPTPIPIPTPIQANAETWHQTPTCPCIHTHTHAAVWPWVWVWWVRAWVWVCPIPTPPKMHATAMLHNHAKVGLRAHTSHRDIATGAARVYLTKNFQSNPLAGGGGGQHEAHLRIVQSRLTKELKALFPIDLQNGLVKRGGLIMDVIEVISVADFLQQQWRVWDEVSTALSDHNAAAQYISQPESEA